MTNDSDSSYNDQSSGAAAFYVYDWADGAIVTRSRGDLEKARPTRFFVTKRLETAVQYARDEATKRQIPAKSAGDPHTIRCAP